MFFVKFLENIFSNSLKDKPGPSFAYIYIFAWLMMNYLYPLAFLSTKGEIALKVSALSTVKESISWWGPAMWALMIIILKPWLNNIGLLAREASDKATQKGLIRLNIKKYKTEEEFQVVTTQIESVKSDNSDLHIKIDQLTVSKNELKSKHERVTELLKSENAELNTHSTNLINNNTKKVDQLNSEKDQLITKNKNIINNQTEKIGQLISEKDKIIAECEESNAKLTALISELEIFKRRTTDS